MVGTTRSFRACPKRLATYHGWGDGEGWREREEEANRDLARIPLHLLLRVGKHQTATTTDKESDTTSRTSEAEKRDVMTQYHRGCAQERNPTEKASPSK